MAMARGPACRRRRGCERCSGSCFTYRGAFFWKMQAGMGDTIFTPLYQALKQKGVTFRFFHRVEDLALSDAGTPAEACIP